MAAAMMAMLRLLRPTQVHSVPLPSSRWEYFMPWPFSVMMPSVGNGGRTKLVMSYSLDMP